MMDERNFRSSYYEKVGFRSVEEKKSLEILLKERPLDKAKLKQFCLRFTVPAMYRNFLWKILLSVIPVYIESHDFIMTQRKAEFEDLQKALRVAKIMDKNIKSHQMFLMMWLLRTRRAKIDMSVQLESPLLRLSQTFLLTAIVMATRYKVPRTIHSSFQHLKVDKDKKMLSSATAIQRSQQTSSPVRDTLRKKIKLAMSKLAESLWHIVDTDNEYDKLVDTYWMLGGFLDQVQKFHKEVGRLQNCTCTLLEREDPDLYKHLVRIEALHSLPFDAWFHSCFAGIISDGSIPKVWDKIAVGAYKILVFVAVVILTTLRRLLLRCESLDNALDAVKNITEETSEVIVNKAIELWQQSGSALVSISQSTVNIVQST